MLALCAQHGIVSDIELIPIQQINNPAETALLFPWSLWHSRPPVEETMRRFIRIAVLTTIVFAAAPALADGPGDQGGECTGGLCGTPNPTPPSFWDELLAWLGLD